MTASDGSGGQFAGATRAQAVRARASVALPAGPADGLADLEALIGGPLAEIARATAAAGGPLPVDLRISERGLDALADGGARERLAEAMRAAGLVVVGADGLAPASLVGGRLKDRLYRPDWRDEERLHFTTALAGLLAELSPDPLPEIDATAPGISLRTIPGAYRPVGQGTGAEADIADGMLRAAAACVGIWRETGRRIALAVEPAPFGLIETAREAVAFFESAIYAAQPLRRFAALAGLSRGQAEETLLQHIGLSYDTAHLAVAGEEAEPSIDRIARAGIPVHRLRIGAALRLDPATPEALAALPSLDAGRELAPAIGRGADGAPLRLADLCDAAGSAALSGARLAVLLRLPLSAEPPAGFASTRPFAEAVLARHRSEPLAPRVELAAAALPGRPVAEAALADLAWLEGRL